MRSRDAIKVVMTTTGSVTGREDQRKPYRWHKIPDWKPGDMRYRENAVSPGGRQLVSAERAQRIAEFAGYRAEDLNIAEAGLRLGISYRTARTYERDRQAGNKQQQGESRNG